MGEVVFNSWRKDAVPLEFGTQTREEIKALVGWGGLALMDSGVNVVELLRAYLVTIQEESCGRCIPCRVGSKVVLDTLTRICRGEGQAEDLDLLERVAVLARDGSLCEIGRSFPIPLLDALAKQRESFVRLIEGKSAVTRNGYRYHKIVTAPCLNGCPAHINIPRYIEKVHEGDFEAALATIREWTVLAGVLGRVCVNPCENNCRRNSLDEPVAIRCLKRFVSDYELDKRKKPVLSHQKPSGLEVAVIGAGPAGLNAAYQLARRGYRVTIFEALPVAGGMLAVGIPSYRLPRDILALEIRLIEDMGVEIRLNTRVGKDISFSELTSKYKAVFVAPGLHESSEMGVAGEKEGYAGFIPGVQFLRQANLGRPTGMGRRVAVVGGGNVAMDCARVAWRLGAEEVYLIYRRSRAEMPANAVEVDEAEREGIQYHFLANPTRMLAEDGRVTGVECIRMELGEPDASGRRSPVPVAGSEFVMEVDTLIPAIGQVADLGFLEGVQTTRRNTIQVDPLTLQTNIPGVFAGGDAVHGARTVIEAIATGNRAAISIDQYLREGKVTSTEADASQALLDALGVFEPGEQTGLVGGWHRYEEVCRPVEERCGSFCEVDLGFTNQVAVKEADRCLRCYRVALVVT
ncbi:MAG: FAD-dependent oxidoreductase [Clostridia bacterium]|nr:MAG: FAD-dependent oxidoreductase [Clostridia bacterium]